MKEIKFKNLSIKNFLSIGEDGIQLDFNEGLNVITGVNLDKEDSKNGVGKSAIADAIFFAAFGTPLRHIHVEDIPNWKTKKQCEVILDFTVTENYITKTYKIIRTLNPSRVKLVEDSEDISRTIGKTNNTLKRIFGSSPDMYEQCILMSVNQTEPFLAKSPATKRKFIEGIFKLDIFSEMLAIIRHDLSETKRLYNIEKTKIDEIQKSLTVYKKQQIEHKNRRDERVSELEQRRINNLNEIVELQNKLITVNQKDCENIEGQIALLAERDKTYEAKIKEILQENTTYQSGIITLKDKIREIETMGNDLCITCKRPFEEADKLSHQSKKEHYKIEINKVGELINTLNKESLEVEQLRLICKEYVTKLIKDKHELEIAEKDNENIRHRIEQCNTWNNQIKIDITNINSDKDTYTELINDTAIRLETLNKKMGTYQHTLQILDISKYVVSEDGVRSFIVKKMLKMLNNRLNYYLQKLDANCMCLFNEYFEETVLNQKNIPCSYFNFSSGERKRIDLAMLFTFLDIRRLQSNVSTNIAFYDELLDSSLDSKGIECVLDILKERINLYKEAIYIISHKSEAIKHATGEIVYLEKQNEITRRTNYDSKI